MNHRDIAMINHNVQFPEPSGIRCLMMPFIQGDPLSVPEEFRVGYENIIASTFIKKGDVGYLTIDESSVQKGKPHRGDRAMHGRALHTEAGVRPNGLYAWGSGNRVYLDDDVKVLLANNIDDSCALWGTTHKNTSFDGDIGDLADDYPYEHATMMKAGDVHEIGILTPHESLPVAESGNRQFLRIISSGVHGREDHFTVNPLMKH
jgi:hypothetical protein